MQPQTARAIRADLEPAVLRRLPPLRDNGPCRRRGDRPAMVLLDLNLAGLSAELAAAREAWGDYVVVVGVGRLQPFACVWLGPQQGKLVEIGPGFLAGYLANDDNGNGATAPFGAPAARNSHDF